MLVVIRNDEALVEAEQPSAALMIRLQHDPGLIKTCSVVAVSRIEEDSPAVREILHSDREVLRLVADRVADDSLKVTIRQELRRLKGRKRRRSSRRTQANRVPGCGAEGRAVDIGIRTARGFRRCCCDGLRRAGLFRSERYCRLRPSLWRGWLRCRRSTWGGA